MSVYRLGSKGDEVRKIQQRLQELGLYRGTIDGSFGGGTDAAVRAFQKRQGLEIDGEVGPNTWKALFVEPIPTPAAAGRPIDQRCLALTGSFETGAAIPECFTGLSGDFDGQGLSLGVLQWNFGQGSLQPLLREMLTKHREVAAEIFFDQFGVLAAVLEGDQEDAMEFARSIQHPVRHAVNEPWRGMFRALCRTAEFQAIQAKYAADRYQRAQGLCEEYGFWSERAVAMMFDIVVQNGSIKAVTKSQILADFRGLPAELAEEDREVAKMKCVANRRADAANPRWAEDVRTRKLCCAKGSGVVHGIRYDLEAQFGIGLRKLSLPRKRRTATATS